MRHLAPIGWLLAVTSCVGLNPSFDESQTEGNSASGGKVSSTGGSSASSQATSAEGVTSTTTSETLETSKGADTSGNSTGTPGTIRFTDDAWEGEFADAEDLGSLGWNEESIQLIGSSNDSVLESRIFDAGSEVQWNELSWRPRAPYQVPLQFPIDEEVYAYPTGNTSVEALQLLLHLEGGPYPHNDPIEDATGLHSPLWIGAPNKDPTTNIRGVFGRGLSHDDDDSMDAHRIELVQAVEPGTGPFTWTVWYRSDLCANMYMMALDSVEADADAGLHFLGCGSGKAFGCNGSSPSHAVGFIQSPGQSPRRICSEATIDDDRWHHLALRRTVVGTGENLEIFVDGVMSGDLPSLTDSITDVSVHPAVAEPEVFTLAGGNDGIYSGAGAYDEFALWNRALTPAEIENLYQRGARTARFQVRACEQPDCSDHNFVGLGGADIEAGYLDPGLEANHTVDLSDLDLRGRYVQYRFLLERPISIPSPAIEAVTVSGTRL